MIDFLVASRPSTALGVSCPFSQWPALDVPLTNEPACAARIELNGFVCLPFSTSVNEFKFDLELRYFREISWIHHSLNRSSKLTLLPSVPIRHVDASIDLRAAMLQGTAAILLATATSLAASVNNRDSSISIPFLKYRTASSSTQNDILRTYTKFRWDIPENSILRKRDVPLGDNKGRDK
jgi:hypothetical protein